MSDDNKLRALVEAMSAGPFYMDAAPRFHGIVFNDQDVIDECQYEADARAIVALRNLAPELLAVVEAARELRTQIGSLVGQRLDRALDALDAKAAEVRR